MFVVWQGRGWFALLGVLLAMSSCLSLIDWNASAALLAAAVALVVSGVVCVWAARVFRRKSAQQAAKAARRRTSDEDIGDELRRGGDVDVTPHTLYWIPLGVWGWIYVVLGVMLAVLVAYRVSRRGWKD